MKPGAAEPTIVAGRYRLDALIASGGMAEVWRAHDTRLDREVAVKVPLAHLRARPDFMERFRREAVAAARLSHPRVVRVYDTGSDPELGAFIVMEMVDGPSLKGIINQGGLDIPRSVELVAEVAGALDFAHRAGVIHRDVKPANVLVAADGPKVADFGIAKAASRNSDMTEIGMTLGTARYLSPEQVEGKPLDARSDVYSLGLVLYELLCGQAPFDADTDLALALKHVTTDPVRPSVVQPAVPVWLDGVVLRCLAKDPDERFASAAELRRTLLAGSSGITGPGANGAGANGSGPRPADAAPTPAAPTTVAPTTAVRLAPAPTDPTSALELASGAPAGAEPGRHGPDPAPMVVPTGPGRSGDRLWLVGAAAVLIVLAAAVAGLISAHLGHGSNTAGQTAVTAPGQSSVQIPVAGAHSFNPAPGSGSEHEELVAGLIDGNPSTYWHTEQYTNPDFGNLKNGVGVYLQLRTPTKIGDLVISSPDTGWAFQVYEADHAAPALSGWGRPVAAGTVGSATTSVALGGHKAGYLLVWISHLTSSDEVTIGELSLFS